MERDRFFSKVPTTPIVPELPSVYSDIIGISVEGAMILGSATLGLLVSAIDGFLKAPIDILAAVTQNPDAKHSLELISSGLGALSEGLEDLTPDHRVFKVSKIGGDIVGLFIGAKGLATAVTKAGQIVKVGKVAEGFRYMISGRGAALARDVAFVVEVDGAAAAEAASVGAASLLMAAGSGKTGLEDLEGLGGGGGEPKSAEEFENSLIHLSPSERGAAIRIRAREIAAKKNWVKRSDLAARNGKHEIYWDAMTEKYYSIDGIHGRFEVCDKRGKHLGEVDFDFNQIPESIDLEGHHNILV
jgi:hypothetical protein